MPKVIITQMVKINLSNNPGNKIPHRSNCLNVCDLAKASSMCARLPFICRISAKLFSPAMEWAQGSEDDSAGWGLGISLGWLNLFSNLLSCSCKVLKGFAPNFVKGWDTPGTGADPCSTLFHLMQLLTRHLFTIIAYSGYVLIWVKVIGKCC